MLELEFAQLSDPGSVRDHNEDFLGCVSPADPDQARTHGWLFALADGVGGQDRGEVASRVAIESILAGFRKAARGESLTSLLPRLVQAANTHVFEAGHAAAPAGSNMATTIVACALRFDRAIISHAGDSRCYLIRQGYAASLTRDHIISNILSRSLGNNMFLSVDTSENQIFAGDTLLLCSDGLHHSLAPDDIVKLAGQPNADLENAAAELVALAKQRDGSDNMSVQLIRVRGVERVGMYRGRHYKLP
jgi:protein phosphatase